MLLGSRPRGLFLDALRKGTKEIHELKCHAGDSGHFQQLDYITRCPISTRRALFMIAAVACVVAAIALTAAGLTLMTFLQGHGFRSGGEEHG